MPYPRNTAGTMVLQATRAGALSRGLMYNHPYARTAQTAIRMYNTGRAAAPYARAAINRFRKYRKTRKKSVSNRRAKQLAKRRVGESIGTSNAKHEANQSSTLMSTRTLYQFPLLNLPVFNTTGGTPQVLDRRINNVVNFRGIKFCINIKREPLTGSAENGNTQQLWVNMAIISPKANLTADETVPVTRFFRNDGQTRSTDFSTALTGLDFRCLPINADEYIIHKHHRMILGPKTSTEGRDERTIEFYWPLKRQIRYEAASSTPSAKNIYLVWWCDISQSGSGGAAFPGAVRLNLKHVKYFRSTIGG